MEIRIIIQLIIIIILTIIVHEFGHYFIAKLYNLNPRIIMYEIGIAVMHKNTDSKKLCFIGAAGIIFGLIFLIFISLLTNIGEFLILSLIGGYIAGCYNDIKELIKNLKLN